MHLIEFISENPYYAENCWDSLNKEDSFTRAGLTAGGYDSISEFISVKEFESLSNGISKKDIKLYLIIEENHTDYGQDYEEIDGDEVRIFKPIDALLNLECGNSIEFDSFILDNQNKNDELINQIDCFMEYIAMYRNNFYKPLWSYADQFLFSFVNENNETEFLSGGEYLDTHGKWELTYGEVVLKSDHLLSDLK